MTRHNRFPATRTLLLLLSAAAIIAPAYAMWPAGHLGPAVVAHVDLERVFNGIDRLSQAQAAVDQAIKPFQERQEELRKEAERLKADLDMLVPGTDKYQEGERDWTQVAVDYQSMGAFIEAKVDSLRAEARRDIYKAIMDGAAQFAQEGGIDYLITDDSGIELQEGNDMQTIQQLALKRIVYANEGLDVTDELIAWMNR